MSIILSQSRNISQWIHASSKVLTLSWRKFLLHRNKSIDLFWKANQLTGFCIIGTSVMKYSRRPSSTIHWESILTCCKVYFASFLSGFSFTNIHDLQDSRWRGRLSPYILSTTSSRFTETWTLVGYCCRERTSVNSWQQESNRFYTLFRIQSFYTCTSSCCCWENA